MKAYFKTIVILFLFTFCSEVKIYSSIQFIDDVSSQKKINKCGEEFEVTQHLFFLEFKDKTSFSVLNSLGVVAKWTIFDSKDLKKTISEGNGDVTPEIEFDKPGVFKCVFFVTVNNVLYSDTSVINVSDTKLIFRPELAKLNKSVKYSKTDSLKGYVLSMPVEYYSYSKSESNFEPKVNPSSGIMGVLAKPLSKTGLKKGKQIISFELYGKPNGFGKAQIGFFNTSGKGFFYNFLVVK